MALDRLYRESIRFDLAYIEAFANPDTPTVAELNNALLVKNVTCALDEDGTEFTLGDPDTDDSLSFCDKAGSSTATFKNPSVTFVGFYDEDRSANGVLNLLWDHIGYADIPYFAILRVGKRSDAPFAIGDIIRIVRVRTDNPVDVLASGENAKYSNVLLNDDFVNWNYKVTA